MKIVGLFFLVCCFTMPVRAVVVTLGASKDNSIYASPTGNSNGGGAGLFSGTNGSGSAARALIKFGLSGIPAGAQITDVKLTLTLGMVAGGGGGGGGGPTNATIGLFKLERDWGEGTAGNNTQSSGIPGSGQGFTAGAGDATWDNAFHAGTAWTNSGGDHASTASASLFLNNNTVGNFFTWLSTAQLVADVQAWLDHPATNFGWELINADESTARTAYVFYSRDWPTFPGGSSSQIPALLVTYTVPEPGTAALLTLGALIASICGRPHARRN